MAQDSYPIKSTMNVSECRQHLPSLLDRLPEGGVVITKWGRPIARLVPFAGGSTDNRRLFGALKGVLTSEGDLFSTGDTWNAES